jgi:choline dehydrogenase-like flavoprotein
MGTTRMASCPEEGVTDANCRVFGTDNLYVAGSAVFPTGPSYSPTFTILALTRRLGQHLLQTTATSTTKSYV